MRKKFQFFVRRHVKASPPAPPPLEVIKRLRTRPETPLRSSHSLRPAEPELPDPSGAPFRATSQPQPAPGSREGPRSSCTSGQPPGIEPPARTVDFLEAERNSSRDKRGELKLRAAPRARPSFPFRFPAQMFFLCEWKEKSSPNSWTAWTRNYQHLRASVNAHCCQETFKPGIWRTESQKWNLKSNFLFFFASFLPLTRFCSWFLDLLMGINQCMNPSIHLSSLLTFSSTPVGFSEQKLLYVETWFFFIVLFKKNQSWEKFDSYNKTFFSLFV